jgi:hypothetical protein
MGVAGQRDQRHAGVQRLDQRGDQIGGAGAERAVAQARAVGDAGERIGSETAGALVIDEVVDEPGPARRIVEGEELEASHAEAGAKPRQLQHARDGLAAAHPLPGGLLMGRGAVVRAGGLHIAI